MAGRNDLDWRKNFIRGKKMAGIKNFEKAEVVTLKEQIDYQKGQVVSKTMAQNCLLYTSDAADEEDSVDLGGRGIIKKKKK